MSDSAENMYSQENKDFVATIEDKNLRESLLYTMRLRENMSKDRDAFEKQCMRLEQQVKDLKATKPTVQEAFDIIKQEMINDNPSEEGSYAHGWHCNIAMMHYDAMAEAGYTDHEARHRVANEGASRFMKILFGVETKA